ncbi:MULTISPECIES: cyclophilin-like fold protein [Levilactobacillus]|uniref:Cyclophilin-like fold protein n=1 Tax=Levilactobacillus fujinensis TaxID=2486024 RepID=A0ABW1TEL6_9LACO|nr:MULTISPECIES: cyclophilin-like fold protein [Levilactobacillus]
MKLRYQEESFPLVVNPDFEKQVLLKLPLTLTFKLNGGHEYFGQLPTTIDYSADLTGKVAAGGIYFFQDWQAFSLNFGDQDISPYQVSRLGSFPTEFLPILQKKTDSLELTLIE